MDTISKQKRSEIMKAVRGKDTQLEVAFRKRAWRKGLRYRKNPGGYFGKPDLAIKKRKIVVFLDSCFWHGCKLHCRIPQANRKYWVAKIRRNVERDQEVTKHYKKIGWRVIRVWEHEIQKNFKKTVDLTISQLK